MRVLVDGLDTVIEEEVIGGELVDGVSGQYDLEAAFTVQCDDGACFLVQWLAGGCRDCGPACSVGDVENCASAGASRISI